MLVQEGARSPCTPTQACTPAETWAPGGIHSVCPTNACSGAPWLARHPAVRQGRRRDSAKERGSPARWGGPGASWQGWLEPEMLLLGR